MPLHESFEGGLIAPVQVALQQHAIAKIRGGALPVQKTEQLSEQAPGHLRLSSRRCPHHSSGNQQFVRMFFAKFAQKKRAPIASGVVVAPDGLFRTLNGNNIR